MKILHMYCTRSRSSVVVPGAVVQMTCGVGSTAPMFVDNAKLFLLICRYVITRWLMKKKRLHFLSRGKEKKGLHTHAAFAARHGPEDLGPTAFEESTTCRERKRAPSPARTFLALAVGARFLPPSSESERPDLPWPYIITPSRPHPRVCSPSRPRGQKKKKKKKKDLPTLALRNPPAAPRRHRRSLWISEGTLQPGLLKRRAAPAPVPPVCPSLRPPPRRGSVSCGSTPPNNTLWQRYVRAPTGLPE